MHVSVFLSNICEMTSGISELINDYKHEQESRPFVLPIPLLAHQLLKHRPTIDNIVNWAFCQGLHYLKKVTLPELLV